MSKFWSKNIQSSELLYYSRAEKFNDENKAEWFKLLNIKDGMRILEVGCGSGHFTNMIKKYYPNCKVFGVDLDENHIKFAKAKSVELGIDVEYQVADIATLPYCNNSFDLVFSHTVVEHLPFETFIKEQRRVLKENGKLIIMYVDMIINKKEPTFNFLNNEIAEIYNSLIFTEKIQKAQYYINPDEILKNLDENGFENLQLQFPRIIYYCPDLQSTKKAGLNQINRHYYSNLYNALFNIEKATNGALYKDKMLELLKKQHEERKKVFDKQKIYDFESSAMIVLTATKKQA